MFDLSWTELLVIAVVALVAIGPKELPRVLYEIGKWVRRAQSLAGEFRNHFSDMMHEAELDELRRQATAARDLTRPRNLAELIDPGGTIRDSLDPTGPYPAATGTQGHAGSPPEPETLVAPKGAVAPPPPLPPATAVAADAAADIAGLPDGTRIEVGPVRSSTEAATSATAAPDDATAVRPL